MEPARLEAFAFTLALHTGSYLLIASNSSGLQLASNFTIRAGKCAKEDGIFFSIFLVRIHRHKCFSCLIFQRKAIVIEAHHVVLVIGLIFIHP